MGFAKEKKLFLQKKFIYSYLHKRIHFCYVHCFVYANEIQKYLFRALGWCLCNTVLLKGFINSVPVLVPQHQCVLITSFYLHLV